MSRWVDPKLFLKMYPSKRLKPWYLKGIRSPNFLFQIWIELDEKITFVKEPLTWDAWFGQERPPNIERLPNFSLYFIFFQDPSKFGRWQQSAWWAYISRPSHLWRWIENEPNLRIDQIDICSTQLSWRWAEIYELSTIFWHLGMKAHGLRISKNAKWKSFNGPFLRNCILKKIRFSVKNH